MKILVKFKSNICQLDGTFRQFYVNWGWNIFDQKLSVPFKLTCANWSSHRQYIFQYLNEGKGPSWIRQKNRNQAI